MNKHLIAVGCVLATAGAASGIVAAAAAQEPPQAVGITLSASSAQITGAEALKQGYTKLTFKASGKGERGFAVFKLRPGVTRQQAETEAPKIDNPADAAKLGTFVASGFIEGRKTYTTSILLDRTSEYALLDFTKKPGIRGWFATNDQSSNAPVPAPDARVTLRDYSFGGATTLPRDGTVQVLNTGKVLHHTLIFPLRKGVDTKKLVRDIKAGKEPGSAFAGPPSALTEIVSPKTTNDVEERLTPGKNLLVCFLQDTPKKPPHAALGMVKVVTVR
jgi:hypothetical protein